MKTTNLLFLALLILLSVAQAATQVSEDLFELEYGENMTLNMEEYSRTTVRIYEGSTLHLNVEDIGIPLRIKTINQDGSVVIDTSTIADQAAELLLQQGNQTPLYFRHAKIKAVFFQPRAFHYTTNPQERSFQLFINVPLFTSQGSSSEPIPTQPTDTPPSSDPYLKYFILVIFVLVIALIVIPPRIATKTKKKKLN